MEESKEELLKFLYDVFRDIENNDIEDIHFSIERGVLNTYEGVQPDNNKEIKISYRRYPKKD